MHWDVVDVKPLEGLALFVRFADGLTGEVRFAPEHLTGVFTPLKDPGSSNKYILTMVPSHGLVRSI